MKLVSKPFQLRILVYHLMLRFGASFYQVPDPFFKSYLFKDAMLATTDLIRGPLHYINNCKEEEKDMFNLI